ncbi:MAG: tRNA 2-selenouridine(34) synthase MnmH [Flavipsychrobacter sp.]
MAIKKISILEFLELRKSCVVLDVRSPGEFAHAHILGAISMPLFTDEERKVVGTSYKQESRERAIKIGLDYFGVKMRKMVEEVEHIIQKNSCSKIIVHCWRGGMRSAGVAWLLDLYGFDVHVLTGGYKAYRKWIHQQFSVGYKFLILSGYTGSGKTLVLKSLKDKQEAAVDLEATAIHRGSSFGGMKEPQPTQEMFENKLGEALANLKVQSEEYIWIEDESQRIGNLNIPPPLWQTMRRGSVCFLDVPFEERLKHIVEEYGVVDKQDLIEATYRIQKRLGGLETKKCIEHLENERVTDAFEVLLKYYDKQYLKAFNKRGLHEHEIETIICKHVSGEENAEKLIVWKKMK